MRLKTVRLAFFFVLTLVVSVGAQAQTKRVIQLSGVIITADSTSGPVPGVHVYVPKAGRGTTSNHTGFFSMPVLVGDSVVISSVGYVRQSLIVPNYHSDFMTVVIENDPKITYLKEVTIPPFPTEEVFKQACWHSTYRSITGSTHAT